MMLRLLLEVRVLDHRGGLMTVEARCKSESCRSSSRIAYGEPRDLLEALSEHVGMHLTEFAKRSAKWTSSPPTKVDS